MDVNPNLNLNNINWKFNILNKVFHAIYRKFLTAIDHIDYHPSQIQNTTRVKRSEEYDVHRYYPSYIRTLTTAKEIFLDKFLMALHKINPSLHSRFVPNEESWYPYLDIRLGSVYSNAQSISKIKDNLHTLQKQNQLQDKQIKHLAKYLNLTMHQVSRHGEMLYKMDTKGVHYE